MRQDACRNGTASEGVQKRSCVPPGRSAGNGGRLDSVLGERLSVASHAFCVCTVDSSPRYFFDSSCLFRLRWNYPSPWVCVWILSFNDLCDENKLKDAKQIACVLCQLGLRPDWRRAWSCLLVLARCTSYPLFSPTYCSLLTSFVLFTKGPLDRPPLEDRNPLLRGSS